MKALDPALVFGAVIGLNPHPNQDPAVLEQTHHASPDVRRFAAYALERVGTEAALTRLEEMGRQDGAEFVRTRVQTLLDRRSERQGD